MRTIYKCQLELVDNQKVIIPSLDGSKTFKDQFLGLEVQYGTPCIWCLVDTEAELREVHICTIGTGHDATSLSKESYLGSYMLAAGNLVFHVFLEGNI